MIQVSTAVFQGPLDLLLQLITRQQVDVAEVSLSRLVEEYLSVVEEMRRLDLEMTSEFLLIAATLVQLKAQRLLPRPERVDLDEELALMEERDLLLARLLACVTIKDVAAVLGGRLEAAGQFLPRTAGFDQPVTPRPAEVRLAVDGEHLARLASSLLADPRLDLDHLDLDLPSVEEAMEDLRGRVRTEAQVDFERVVAGLRTVEVVAFFLAMLELARLGLIEVRQPDWLSAIELRSRGER